MNKANDKNNSYDLIQLDLGINKREREILNIYIQKIEI